MTLHFSDRISRFSSNIFGIYQPTWLNMVCAERYFHYLSGWKDILTQKTVYWKWRAVFILENILDLVKKSQVFENRSKSNRGNFAKCWYMLFAELFPTYIWNKKVPSPNSFFRYFDFSNPTTLQKDVGKRQRQSACLIFI